MSDRLPYLPESDIESDRVRPRALTIRGVTERYGWGRSKTYEMLGDGRLEGIKVDDLTLILVDSCEQVVRLAPRFRPATKREQEP